ncbi:MAG: type II toxin-antitoxin system RelE/ParE family toxin [Blastocatellia bacterium]|nr:type II toxin-antitoxin system RelE/ParE family toxin [Blastocatellia bacterium]
MARFIRSESAHADLLEIWEYLAEDNPISADAFIDTLNEKCRMIAGFPEMGRAREELAPRLRSFPVGRFVIYYRPMENGIEIVRMLHASREISGITF